MEQYECENCGNQYDKPIRVTMGEETHIYDSFECAINQLAPQCSHCDTRIIGHGVEESGKIYCCASCAAQEGATDLKDRVY